MSLFSAGSRRTLVHTQSHILWLPGNLALVVKHPNIDTTHSPTFKAKGKNTWSYTHVSSHVFLTRSLSTDLQQTADVRRNTILHSCEDLKQLHSYFCFFGVTKYFIKIFLCLIRICFLSPYTISFP